MDVALYKHAYVFVYSIIVNKPTSLNKLRVLVVTETSSDLT